MAPRVGKHACLEDCDREHGLTQPLATIPAPPQHDLYQCAMYLHHELSERDVPYYFLGGFACINVGMTARTTSDIDIAVPSGQEGYGTLLDILGRPPFIQDRSGVLPKDSYYFYVESSGSFVEVDGVLAGLFAFPRVADAELVKLGPQMKLSFLSAPELLRLKFSTWNNETRRKSAKRHGDMSDITSIRDLMIRNRQTMGLKALQGDMANGLKAWVKEFQDLKEWQKIDSSYKG